MFKFIKYLCIFFVFINLKSADIDPDSSDDEDSIIITLKDNNSKAIYSLALFLATSFEKFSKECSKESDEISTKDLHNFQNQQVEEMAEWIPFQVLFNTSIKSSQIAKNIIAASAASYKSNTNKTIQLLMHIIKEEVIKQQKSNGEIIKSEHVEMILA